MAIDYEELAVRLERMGAPDGAIARGVAEACSTDGGTADILGAVDAGNLASSDFVLRLVDAMLPGWSIHLTGTAQLPDGHWRGSLRETDARDSDEYLGVGRGATPAIALTVALLRALAYRAAHAGTR